MLDVCSRGSSKSDPLDKWESTWSLLLLREGSERTGMPLLARDDRRQNLRFLARNSFWLPLGFGAIQSRTCSVQAEMSGLYRRQSHQEKTRESQVPRISPSLARESPKPFYGTSFRALALLFSKYNQTIWVDSQSETSPHAPEHCGLGEPS